MRNPRGLNVLPEVADVWAKHHAAWSACEACPSLCQSRTSVVLARGELPCEVLFVGEGPGEREDELGVPFCGPSGTLLNVWVSAALAERTYAITNVVACRPATPEGANRPPTRWEVDACRPRLLEFVLNCAKPKVIVALGRIARDNMPRWGGLPVCSLYHPAYVLRWGGSGCAADRDTIAKLTDFIGRYVP